MKEELFDIREGFRSIIDDKIEGLERTMKALLKAGLLPDDKRAKFEEAIDSLRKIRDEI